MMAEIRMLQEQQQQLQQLLGALQDTLQDVQSEDRRPVGRHAARRWPTRRWPSTASATTSRVLREKTDETNVRLSSMAQELESLRQTIASQPAPHAVAPLRPGIPASDAAARRRRRRPRAGHAAPVERLTAAMYDELTTIYTAGRWDLAIQGFQGFIRVFPTHPIGGDAQFNIGNVVLQRGEVPRGARRVPEGDHRLPAGR